MEVQLRRNNLCPICSTPLKMPCAQFSTASAVSEDQLKEYANEMEKKGGRKRKTRRLKRTKKSKTKKSLKKYKNKN